MEVVFKERDKAVEVLERGVRIMNKSVPGYLAARTDRTFLMVTLTGTPVENLKTTSEAIKKEFKS